MGSDRIWQDFKGARRRRCLLYDVRATVLCSCNRWRAEYQRLIVQPAFALPSRAVPRNHVSDEVWAKIITALKRHGVELLPETAELNSVSESLRPPGLPLRCRLDHRPFERKPLHTMAA